MRNFTEYEANHQRIQDSVVPRRSADAVTN